MVVLGAAIATIGSAGTTWLNAWLIKRNDPEREYDAAVKSLLKALLEKGPKWRKATTLASIIGLDKKLTKEYLIVIGARGSQSDPELWGLVSRNPLQDIDDSTQNTIERAADPHVRPPIA